MGPKDSKVMSFWCTLHIQDHRQNIKEHCNLHNVVLSHITPGLTLASLEVI